MSRLLRKGAVIGKAALVLVVAGLLLYGAVKVVNADWGDADQKTPDAYLAEARAALATGDISEASETIKTMMTSLPADTETARAAERTGKEMAARGKWTAARELYSYAAQYAEGETLKLALCGVARSEAEKGGDFQKAVDAAKATAVHCQTDERVTKVLMQAGDRLAGNRRLRLACQVYEAIAENAPAGREGLKAVKALGVGSARLQDAATAKSAAERLMGEDYRTVGGWAAAVDEIATKLSEQKMCDEAVGLYEKLTTSSPDVKTSRIAACGIAAALITNRRSEEAAVYLEALTSADGEITEPAFCGKLGSAYIAVGQFTEAMQCFQKVADAENDTSIGWRACGKVAECAIRVGADDIVDATITRMIEGYGVRKDRSKTLFDYARRYVIKGRLDRAAAMVELSKAAMQGDDARWEVAARAAIAITKGADTQEWIDALAPSSDGKTAGDALFEVGKTLLYRGIEIEGKDGDSSRLFASADKLLECVTANCPIFTSTAAVWHKRADCAQHLGDYAAAVEYAMTAIGKDPYYEYAGHCYIVAIMSYHAMGLTDQDSAALVREEILKLCKAAREDCGDEKMIVDFATTVEQGYADQQTRGGAL